MRRMNVVNRKQAIKVVKELDAFAKVPEDYQETTATGGGVSILVFVLIVILVISEIVYYTSTDLRFEYEVDNSHEGKLKINIDITVAMSCGAIGADILDLTGKSVDSFGQLNEEAVHFELSPKQRQYQDMMQQVNGYIKNEYHAIHEFLWKTGYQGMATGMPAREDQPTTQPDGCRLHGYFLVNKVAGNFHITAGKSVPVYPRGHAHLALMVDESEYNFSHRIDQFSFGESSPGIINPLDGDEKVATANYHIFQYFIQVVPTKVKTVTTNVDTYQYAVTETNRTINHSKGSHGVPGIFVKYDLASFKVVVAEEYKPFWQFLVRLCGIIGGIFATSGLLHGLVGFLIDILCCKYKLGKYKPKEDPIQNQSIPTHKLNDSLPADNVHGISLLSQEEPVNSVPLAQ